jgi:hypothetical protein
MTLILLARIKFPPIRGKENCMKGQFGKAGQVFLERAKGDNSSLMSFHQ